MRSSLEGLTFYVLFYSSPNFLYIMFTNSSPALLYTQSSGTKEGSQTAGLEKLTNSRAREGSQTAGLEKLTNSRAREGSQTAGLEKAPNTSEIFITYEYTVKYM